MQVCVDNAIQAPALQRVSHQRQRLLAVRYVAGIDQRRRLIVVEQQHIVRRHPATFKHSNRRSQFRHGNHEVRRPGSCAHTARFSSSLICDHLAISSIEREQPSHQPLRAFILHTEIHGEGTGDSMGTGGNAFKLSRFASIAASD